MTVVPLCNQLFSLNLKQNAQTVQPSETGPNTQGLMGQSGLHHTLQAAVCDGHIPAKAGQPSGDAEPRPDGSQ